MLKKNNDLFWKFYCIKKNYIEFILKLNVIKDLNSYYSPYIHFFSLFKKTNYQLNNYIH